MEAKELKAIERVVVDHPLWIGYLNYIHGIKYLNSGNCIAYLSPYAHHPSAWWKYTGYDVVDGVGGRAFPPEERPFPGEPARQRHEQIVRETG